ncbi:MAG: hypothetical protein IJ637_01915 [Prevotella sp.]|nr:hypothetical protein [Prevotella sp.]
MMKTVAAAAYCVLTLCPAMAQDIATIAKSDPLIMTGSVGTANTYHYTSVGDGYASPMSNAMYANLNISLYGISMPFAFYYTNDNTSFSYPQFTFSLSPSYKAWTGHLGQSSMDFSSYVLNMSWMGVGLEYNTERLRVGAFYGKLRSAVNDDPNDPAARAPQYRRMGWGFKVGYGSGKNYVDLYMLRAYDCLNTINETWREVVAPQENFVVGLKGCVTPVSWASLTANLATSLFNTDKRADKIDDDAARRWDQVFDVRYSSLMRFAGDAALNLRLPMNINATICYRMIQPDYTSLGTYYMANNYHSLGISLSTMLFNRVSVSGNFSGQRDNLTDKQLYTTSGYVYSVQASARVNNNLNVSAGYNGYTQVQSDGTATVNDSTRVHRQLHSISLTPTYMFETGDLGHTVSLTANYTENKDLNRFTESQSHSNVTTKALGLSYGLNVKPWQTDFSLSLSHQQTEGYRSRYRSEVGTLSASRAFLEEKNLTASASLTMCYNEVLRQSKSLSMGAEMSMGYTLKKVHTFSLAASFSKYGDVNISQTRSKLDCTDISCSLNYAYTFSLLEIKRKAKSEDQ